jgi:hypothetical protein
MKLKPKEVATLVLLVNSTGKRKKEILSSLKGNAKKIALAIVDTQKNAKNSIHTIAGDSIKKWVKNQKTT